MLIDEARTPLIISSEADRSADTDLYKAALRIAGDLQGRQDFVILETERATRLTATGAEQVAKFANRMDGVWRSRRAREELVEQALAAINLFERDKHYIIAEDKVQIVDDFTGRVMPDRSWERELHQLIEVKEDHAVTGRRQTLAQITYQRFFRRYIWLAGMTGTACEVARELKMIYELNTSRIPTHPPGRRQNRGMRIYRTADEKWEAVVCSITDVNALGRPVLVGTRSVSASEALAERLRAADLPHVVLNARQDKLEAEIVEAAGNPGKITVATNMAGRGTDIRLGPGVADLGGLHVILTEFHESSRIDRQLFGRAGRQGDPGTFEAIVSLDDEIFVRFAKRLTETFASLLNDRPGPLPRRLGDFLRRIAQYSAEAYNFKTRQETMRRNKQLDKAMESAGISE